MLKKDLGLFLLIVVVGIVVSVMNPRFLSPINLGNTANQPGTPVINPTTAGAPADGTITFFLYGPDQCTTLAAGFPSAGIAVSVSGSPVFSEMTMWPSGALNPACVSIPPSSEIAYSAPAIQSRR